MRIRRKTRLQPPRACRASAVRAFPAHARRLRTCSRSTGRGFSCPLHQWRDTRKSALVLNSLPVRDVRVISLAAFLAVGTVGEKVIALHAVVARTQIVVGIAPGIVGYVLAQVRALPVVGNWIAGGRFHQGLQPLLSRGV